MRTDLLELFIAAQALRLGVTFFIPAFSSFAENPAFRLLAELFNGNSLYLGTVMTLAAAGWILGIVCSKYRKIRFYGAAITTFLVSFLVVASFLAAPASSFWTHNVVTAAFSFYCLIGLRD